jgi:DNA polymerase type B, organellar and viral
MEPLKFGKLLDQTNNKFIIQLTTKNIAVINHYDKENFIRIFKNGDLVLEFRDKFISDNSFIRTINDTKFLFENDKLISTQIINASGSITIFNNTPLYEDTNALQLKQDSNFRNSIFKWLENTYIFKYKKAELFILFELFLIFSIFIICFVIFPEVDSVNTSLAVFSKGNIIKLRRTLNRNAWDEYKISLNNKIFTKNLFENLIKKFWNKIEYRFTNDNHLYLLFKIQYNDGNFASIGSLQRLNKDDLNWYIDFILSLVQFKSEYYKTNQIKEIIITYGFKNEKIPNKIIIASTTKTTEFNKVNIINSMIPSDFGSILKTIKTENSTIFIIQNELGQTITLEQFENYNLVTIAAKGTILISFKDEFINNNEFIRIIDNKKYYFKDNLQVLFMKELKTKFISKIKKSEELTNKFITLDIETFIKNGELIPYLICIYDGENKLVFWLWDYNSVEEMILEALNSILIRKYHGYKVYIHNMAKFDIIFILKYLLKIADCHPIIHNDKMLSLRANFGKNNEYQIEFKDSYLILLASLSKLSKYFKIKSPKTIFPFLFVNENNLDYKGKVPSFEMFDNKISREEYNNYKSKFNNNWVLKAESIKYCNIDCLALYQIIIKFNSLIFGLFGLNIHHYLTLPSLAFAIFRSNFMDKENIPQLSGKIASDIREGYTGGAVDMYIPQGIGVKGYDVNSLYPSQMQSQLMPVGNISYFEGDISLTNLDLFGFFYCKITAPDDIKHPILQTHVKINNGLRTMAPIGTWNDMLFSEELINAIKYGYTFEILWGYLFEKENIFKNYVDLLYNLRQTYNSDDPMNFIAKILLNSLYGRFGMDDNFDNITIVHKDFLSDFEDKFLDFIVDRIEVGDYWIIFYSSVNTSDDRNVSVAISAAITAYSRIHMSQFKNNPDFNLYYTDTDSIYTDSDVDSYFIDNKQLGKLKFESESVEAIFLAPKMYCLNIIDQGLKYKIKGLKSTAKLNLDDFKNLLIKNFVIKKEHTKWFRNLDEAKISLLEQIYTIKVTENKRKLLYNKNNKLIATKAYKINLNKEIIN